MKKFLILIFALVLPWFAKAETDSISDFAEPLSYTIESVPKVYTQDRRQHVSDPAHLLSDAARHTINQYFTLLEDSTGIQAMVVMLPTIGEENIFDYAHNLFMEWGIGHKNRDNGLLILYVADQKKIRFHVGYGLEGVLPDALCKRIQTKQMIPAFKEGQTDKGMVLGAQAIYQILEKAMKPQQTDNTIGAMAALAVVLLMLALFFWGIKKSQRRALTCRKCNKEGALQLSSRDYYTAPDGHRHKKEIYICKHCHAVEVRDIDVEDDDDGGLLEGMIIGSMLGGGHRSFGGGGFGGGSIGGSFGGGSSGGGGSTSSW